MSYSPFFQSVRRGAVPLVVLAVVAGCGGSGDTTTVRGSVTFNGKPVEKGYINFHPSDNKGRSVGGEIRDGKFVVKDVLKGKCRVEVIATPSTEAPDSMGDSIKDAKDAKVKQEAQKDLIAANSEGNNQVHEIGSGTELALALKTSDSSGPAPKSKVSDSSGPLPNVPNSSGPLKK